MSDGESNVIIAKPSHYEDINVETIFDIDMSKRMAWPLPKLMSAGKETNHTTVLSDDGAFFSASDSDQSVVTHSRSYLQIAEEGDCNLYEFLMSSQGLPEVILPCWSDSLLQDLPDSLVQELPKKLPITLVLDLDETLVHSTFEGCEDADFSFAICSKMQLQMVFVRERPYLQLFLQAVASMFEIVIFTAGHSIYAGQLLDILDPGQTLIGQRVYRDSCVCRNGGYLKDLTILGRDLARIVIVDNSPQAFQLQVENGIPIKSWFGDRSDSALLSLLFFLETLVGADDVRPIIKSKFGYNE